MCAKAVLPPGLPAEIAGPLVEAAERVALLKPWEFMSDVHLIGVRDERTNELLATSVLGALREVFAVVCYRGDAGLRWIHSIVTGQDKPDPDDIIEAMDFLKVEWIVKAELQQPDLDTLKTVGYKPPARGRQWPVFRNGKPGWQPWFLSEPEAQQMTGYLRKVARFAALFRLQPGLYDDHMPGEIPLVPAGEASLGPDELEWMPLLPVPEPEPEPFRFSEQERAQLAALPVRHNAVFELIVPLMPELAFLDEQAGRPCLARMGLLADRESYFVLAGELVHGASPLREAAGKALVRGLRAAKARPGAIHVKTANLRTVVRAAAEAIGVPVRVVSQLNSAEEAAFEMQHYFQSRKPV